MTRADLRTKTLRGIARGGPRAPPPAGSCGRGVRGTRRARDCAVATGCAQLHGGCGSAGIGMGAAQQDPQMRWMWPVTWRGGASPFIVARHVGDNPQHHPRLLTDHHLLPHAQHALLLRPAAQSRCQLLEIEGGGGGGGCVFWAPRGGSQEMIISVPFVCQGSEVTSRGRLPACSSEARRTESPSHGAPLSGCSTS